MGPKLLSGIFYFKSFSFYTKWCAQTFPPIIWIFVIFDRHFSESVVPSSNEYENHVLHLKGRSLTKKTVKTASKSTHKPRRNDRSSYAPRRTHSPPDWSVTEKQKKKHTNTTFSHLQLARVVRSPQTLHGDRGPRDHVKRCQSFFDPTHSFSYRVHGKIRGKWLTRGFSTISP